MPYEGPAPEGEPPRAGAYPRRPLPTGAGAVFVAGKPPRDAHVEASAAAATANLLSVNAAELGVRQPAPPRVLYAYQPDDMPHASAEGLAEEDSEVLGAGGGIDGWSVSGAPPTSSEVGV